MFRDVLQIEDPDDDPREFHQGDPLDDAAMDPFFSMLLPFDPSTVFSFISPSAYARSYEPGHVRSAFISA